LSDKALSGMTIAITGANGFIGARVVELLTALEAPPRLRLLSRRPLKGREHIVVDISDPIRVRAALNGCDALVHCAFDFTDMAANIRIASVLADACVAGGTRLVHVSTAAVHEPFPDGDLDETRMPGSGGSEYKHVKLEIENNLVARVRNDNLDLVILQPTVVYGPAGRAWTDSPVRELLTGTVVLPDEGHGLCNAVYIDDVCQAVIAALTASLPSGERILVSGPAPVTWRAFYSAYQNMLRLDALRFQPADSHAATRHSVAENDGDAIVSREPGRSAAKRLKAVVSRVLGGQTVTRLNVSVSFLKSLVLGGTVHTAVGSKRALFRSRCHIRIDKAQRLLGFEPRFDLTDGMRETAPYILRSYGRLAWLRSIRHGSAREPQNRDAVVN
jgi:nucleoside-diphosphate-sugar epimerase